MIRCLIVDDEIMAHQILEHYIAQTPGLTLVAKCRNALEAFAMLEKHRIDLMFLDIEMPLVNGLSLLKTLTVRPAVILTTAYAEYAVDSYELDVIDYLLKPYSLQRFIKAIEKFRRTMSSPAASTPAPESYWLIREKGGQLKVPHNHIISIEASRDYMKVTTTGPQHLVHITMRQLEEELPPERFVRVHKSYIVSLLHVRIVRADEVLLSNNTTIPVSANYKDRLMELFTK